MLASTKLGLEDTMNHSDEVQARQTGQQNEMSILPTIVYADLGRCESVCEFDNELDCNLQDRPSGALNTRVALVRDPNACV